MLIVLAQITNHIIYPFQDEQSPNYKKKRTYTHIKKKYSKATQGFDMCYGDCGESNRQTMVWLNLEHATPVA